MSISSSDDNNSTVLDKSKFYNASFRLLSGRKHSIIAQQPNLNEEITITEEVNIDAVEKTVVSIHNFVSHLITVKKSFETIFNNLEFLRSKDNLSRNVVESILELTYICRHILSQNCDEDKDLYIAKLSHSKSLAIYQTQLCDIVNSSSYQRPENSNYKRRLAAVTRMLKKLNTARIIKRNLIGAFEFDPSNRQGMRSSCRRKLTLEDFLK